MLSVRQKGLAQVGLGLLVIVGNLVFAWKVVKDLNRPIIVVLLLGGALVIKGAVEAVLDTTWNNLDETQTKVLQVLAFLALAGIAIGIAVATT